MFSFVKIAATAAVIAVSSVAAQAATLYDGSGFNTTFSDRSAGDAPIGNFIFSEEVEITGITQNINASADGNAQFVIFEGDNLVFSSISAVTGGIGFQDIASAAFSFTAAADTNYFIGAFLDVAALYSFGDSDDDVQGIVTQFDRNQNVTDFAAPRLRGLASATIAVSLNAETTAPVPLPAGLPLMLLGLGAIGVMRRRTR